MRQASAGSGGQQQNMVPERVYALVNTTSDPLMQLATTYSADEIGFVKRLLDAMFDTNNTRRQEAMAVSDTQAIQLSRAEGGGRRESQAQTQEGSSGSAQSLTMTQAEIVLRRLVEEGWLEISRKGYYSLTPRALMELRAWLVTMYNEDNEKKIKFCAACKDIITVVSFLAWAIIHGIWAWNILLSDLYTGPTMCRS